MNPNSLQVGKVYFHYGFSDPDLLVPDIEAYVYVRTENGMYHFQDPSHVLAQSVLEKLSSDQRYQIENLITDKGLLSVDADAIETSFEDLCGIIQLFERIQKEAENSAFY